MDSLHLEVVGIRDETDRIKTLFLDRADGLPLPAFDAGAHVDLYLPNGMVRQYSLLNDPAESGPYVLGVLRELRSRGGSEWVHQHIETGLVLKAAGPRNNFPLAQARRHLLIAGGIGVTPMLSMAAALHRLGEDFHRHYCTRSPEQTAYLDRIAAAGWDGRMALTHDGGDPGQGLDVRALLSHQREGDHVYCCGPAGLMGAVREASGHWATGTVHFEWFTPDEIAVPANDRQAFTVVLARSDRVLKVPADASIVQVLADNGIVVDTLCEEGICGTCITNVLEGEPEHHDSVLTDAEKASNRLMTVCCSRAKGDRLVLDL